MYTVFGYDFMGEEFEMKFDSFVQAIKTFKKLESFNIVFFMREGPNTCMYIF